MTRPAEPATNQAGEVGLRDQLDKCAALLIDVLEADPGPKANAAYAAARKWWREYDAALATQPATSQEGEVGTWFASARGHLANIRAHGNAEKNACLVIERALDAATALASASFAATPTPPTLSEDLREAQVAVIKAVISMYHTTRLTSDFSEHILSKPIVQRAFSNLMRGLPA